MVMPPKKRPEELLCFFGTRDARRRTAIPKCHGLRDFSSQRGETAAGFVSRLPPRPTLARSLRRALTLFVSLRLSAPPYKSLPWQ